MSDAADYIEQRRLEEEQRLAAEFLASLPVPAPNVDDLNIDTSNPADTRESGGANRDPALMARRDAAIRQAVAQVRLVPGAAPDIGVLPDGTPIHLTRWTKIDPATLDSATLGFLKLATRHFNRMPRYQDYQHEIQLSGRGYRFRGQPSEEEAALEAQFLAGDERAAGPLAQLRMRRLVVTPRPGIDRIMRPLTLGLMAAGYGAMAGPMVAPFLGSIGAGAVGGAVGGGLTSMMASEGDWRQTLLGAGTGAVGGAAGAGVAKPIAQAAGGGVLGGAAGGAAGGAVSGSTRAGLTLALGGEVNPWDILTSTVAGGVGGGVAGGMAGLDLGDVERFLLGMGTGLTKSQVAQLLRDAFPEGHTGLPPNETPGNPFMSPESALEFHRAQLAAQMEEYKAQLAEFNAAKSAALAEATGQRDAAIAEFQARQREALERLRGQALAYLEQARSARQTPLPPIPGLAAPALPPPPDPFDPSTALRGQSFSAEGFPTAPAPGGDFRLSQEPALPVQPAAAPPAKAAIRRLPLNIQQIQAALAARRR